MIFFGVSVALMLCVSTAFPIAKPTVLGDDIGCVIGGKQRGWTYGCRVERCARPTTVATPKHIWIGQPLPVEVEALHDNRMTMKWATVMGDEIDNDTINFRISIASMHNPNKEDGCLVIKPWRRLGELSNLPPRVSDTQMWSRRIIPHTSRSSNHSNETTNFQTSILFRLEDFGFGQDRSLFPFVDFSTPRILTISGRANGTTSASPLRYLIYIPRPTNSSPLGYVPPLSISLWKHEFGLAFIRVRTDKFATPFRNYKVTMREIPARKDDPECDQQISFIYLNRENNFAGVLPMGGCRDSRYELTMITTDSLCYDSQRYTCFRTRITPIELYTKM